MSDAPVAASAAPVPALGGVLSVLDTLGPAPRSNWTRAPLPGNDFAERFVEDLEVLAQSGVRAVRLGIDWSRVQGSPGRVDDDWREWYLDVITAARRSGIAVWASLVESTVPAWFDDEGSFADGRNAGLAWPRWVEMAAELFGDLVDGWFPMIDPVGIASQWAHDSRKHETALLNIAVAWRDSWRILRGGPPVATALGVHMIRPADQSVPAAQRARFEDHLRWRLWTRALRDGVVRLPNGNERIIADLGGSLDRLGVTTTLDLPEQTLDDEALRRWSERLGTVIRRTAEEGPDRPIDLASLTIAWPNTSERHLIVETTVAAVRAASGDGVPVQQVFVEPAIGARSTHASSLVDRDRQPSGDLDAWRHVLPGASGQRA